MKYLITVILFLSVQNLSAQVANDKDSIDINKWYKNLPEVIVKAEKPIVKLVQGKMVYNMHNLLEKLPADNAYEALTRIPGVSDATGTISLLGNAVTLIINGQATTLTQEQLAERLKAMPAAQLAKAEVMLSAPARYHVRGMAINIVTKDNAGTNRLSGQVVGGLQQSKYSTGFGNLALSMQRGKFGLDANYQFVDGNSYREASHIANHPLGNKRVGCYDETWQKSFGIRHYYRLGMNYAFNKNHRLDIAYTGNWKKNSSNSQTTGLSVSRTHLGSHAYLHNVDVNYSLPFGLTLGGSYTYYRTPQQQWLDGTMQVDENTTETERNLTSGSEQTINKWMFTADQTHSLAHGWGLSYGEKGQFASNKSYQNTLDKKGNILPNATAALTSMSGYGTCMQVSVSRSIRQSVLRLPLLPSNTTLRCGISGAYILRSMLCGASTTTICSTSPSIPIQCFRAIGQP